MELVVRRLSGSLWRSLLFVLISTSVLIPLRPIDGQTPAAPQKTEPERSLAIVQGRAIGMAEVRFLLSQIHPATTGQRDVVELWLQKSGGDSGPLPSSIPDEVISAAVQQWIERLIVLSFLERQQLSVPRAKVEADLQSWDQRLRELGTSLEEFRQTSGISRESLFQFRHWELSWQSYLDRRLTEESLQKYFQQFQAEFDGTQKRVAHIVLVMPADVSQTRRIRKPGPSGRTLRARS